MCIPMMSSNHQARPKALDAQDIATVQALVGEAQKIKQDQLRQTAQTSLLQRLIAARRMAAVSQANQASASLPRSSPSVSSIGSLLSNTGERSAPVQQALLERFSMQSRQQQETFQMVKQFQERKAAHAREEKALQLLQAVLQPPAAPVAPRPTESQLTLPSLSLGDLAPAPTAQSSFAMDSQLAGLLSQLQGHQANLQSVPSTAAPSPLPGNAISALDLSGRQPLASSIMMFRKCSTPKNERFPVTLYRMIHETSTQRKRDDIVSFTPSGAGFEIHRPDDFEREILPLYFAHGKLSSFKRQLNLYGFRLLSHGVDSGAYAHPIFCRDDREASERIKRLK